MTPRDKETLDYLYRKLSRRLLGNLTNDQLRDVIRAVAGIFHDLKQEAIRREVWNDLRGEKVK